jgi:hypothetical protein
LVIKPTTDAEVRALVEALGADDRGRREAAVARLIIIGSRACGRLLREYGTTADRGARIAILQVLEASRDERALPVARDALGGGGDLAVAAVGVFRELLSHEQAAAQAQALDALLSVAGEPSADRRVRAAAADALQSAPEDVRRAIAAALPPVATGDEALWQDAVEGRLPDDPQALRSALQTYGERAPLAVLRRLIEAVRAREQDAGQSAAAAEWRPVRGALHQAVALRGSRVALYDLRESVEAATDPLPASFVGALQVLGDASCLEPLALAFSRAPGPDRARWRQQLAHTFRAIVKRERLTRKHAAMRRALARAPGIADA